MSAEQRARMYPPGSKVKILRGELAGKVLTVALCTADEIRLVECPKRDVMSKENVMPADDLKKIPNIP